MSWMNDDSGEFVTWDDDPDFMSSIQQQQAQQEAYYQQQAQEQQAQPQQYQPQQPQQYIDTAPDIDQDEAQYLATYQNMNVADVSTELITKLRDVVSGWIPEWYNEIKTSIDKQNFPNYIKFYFLRLFIEYYTGNYILGKELTPAQAAAQVKQTFLNGNSLRDAVGAVQTVRYQQIVNLPLNNVILEHAGLTEEEAHVFFKFWKKNKQKPDFWESYKTQFYTEKYVFGDNAYQINLSYAQLASTFLGDMGKLHTDWRNLNETSNGLNILRSLHLSIFENEDFQPSFIDFWTQGKGDDAQMIKENLDFEKLMHAIQGEIGINDFLSVQGTTTIISHNLPFKNLEKAILTLQASGERITAENVAKQYFALGADYQKLKEIAEIRARLAELKRHGTLQARAMLKTMIRDKDKFWERFNISNQLPENLQHYFNDLENSIRAQRHDFMEREFQFADDNRDGDENKWFEEQITILMKSLDETNDKLRNSLKEKEAQASNGAKTTIINVEKILSDAIAKRNAIIDEIKNGNIKRDAVKDMLKAKNPEVTNKEIEEEAAKYKDKDVDTAKMMIENEKQLSENQWLDVYNYFAEVMSEVRRKVPGQNGEVIEIPLLTYSDPEQKTIPEDQYKKLEPRIKKLKEKHKGNADAAIADLKEDKKTRLPMVMNLYANQSEYDKAFLFQDWAALLDSYDWDIERWYDYIFQVIPKLQTLIKYNSQYDNNYGAELRNPSKPISSIVKLLDDKIVEYQKRQNIIATDQDVMNFISTNSDFITIEEVAGHAKDAKEAKIYIKMKVALKNKSGWDCGVDDYSFRQKIDVGFYSKEINGDVIKWDQRMKKENPALAQEMVKTTEKNQNFYGLPKEKFDDLRYWKDIDDEKWRLKYFEVENNFGVLKKIDPDAKNCKSFEDYIVKKNNPDSSPAYSSDKQCFIKNAVPETDNAALQIKNFISRFDEFQKAKYNMISGDFKGEYTLELARRLWNKNINKPHFETIEQCAKWLMDSGKRGEAGISYLVNEVNSRNQSLFADKNFNKVWEKWAKFAADNLVVLEPKDVMARAVGGYQALQTMLNAIEKNFWDEYFKYYFRIDLAKYFKNKQASNGELKVDPEEIYTGLTNDIQKAKSVIRDFQNTMTSLDNDRIEINKELSKEYADQHPEDDYLDIGIELYDTKPCDWESRFKVWGGNINKMKAEVLILYYNALCDKQNRLGEQIDPTHMIICESIADKLDERVAPSFTKASQLYRDQQKSGKNVQIPNPPDDMAKCNVVLKRHNVPIWYTSRTHTQLKQLVGELKKLDYHPQMTILASRKRLCLFKQVSQSSNVDMACLSAMSKKKCPYLFEKKIPPDFRPFGTLEKFDTDDLIRYCEQRMLCPYRLSRYIMKSADLILCPYNFIMNPKVKGQMMLTILGVILVVDEAHNIESVIKESTSFDHDRGGLQTTVGMINKYLKNQENPDFQENLSIIRDLFTGYLRYINDKSVLLREKNKFEFIESNNVDFFASIGITKLTWPRIRVALDYTFVVGNAGRLPGVGTPQKISMFVLDYLEQLYVVIALCFKNNCRFMNAFKLIVNLGTVPEEDHLLAINLDPGAYFSTVADEVNSVILSSGTLSPLNQMACELGTPFKVQLTASHIISSRQLEIFTVGQGMDNKIELLGTYKNMEANREKIEIELGNILIKILPAIPGGVLFFMPSHNSLSSMISTWQKYYIIDKIRNIKQIFFEEQNINAEMYSDYKSAIEKEGGAILLGVCRGRMSEGIDFYDDQARSVIVFGIPYPPRNDRDIQLKMQFNDDRLESIKSSSNSLNQSFCGMSGNDWYDAQAYRALFQATGRCIRHSKDYGSIILIDSRFAKNVGRFPRWMQQSFIERNTENNVVDIDVNLLPDKLSEFYSCMSIEFPPRFALRKGIPTSICCSKCDCFIVDIESLDENTIECLQVTNRPGLHEICNTKIEDGSVFIRKENQKKISDEISFEEAVYSTKDVAAYQPMVCRCGETLGAVFKVGKLEDISMLDGLFLAANRVAGNQGNNSLPITTVLDIKRSYTFTPQGKGQQVLCLTPNSS